MLFCSSHSLSRVSAWLLLGLLYALNVGCASYSKSFQKIEQELATHNPAAALQVLEKQSHSGRNQLLYLLNKAMLLRMLQDYKNSNQAFEGAKKIIREFSAASVTEETSAFLINDTTRTYIGTPLEQVMIHLYAALNYLEMGQLNAARVEALQVDVRLRELAQDDPDSILNIDPFARYITGLIYEELQEWSDAMIAYRKAYKAYLAHNDNYGIKVPTQLKHDLLRLTRKMGLDNEHNQYEKLFGIEKKKESSLQNKSELVFIFHKDLAPIKHEKSVHQVDPISGYLLRISLPYYVKRSSHISHARINVNEITAKTELMEDINNIALKTLDAHLPAITARTFARAAIKYRASLEAGKDNDLAGLMMNIAGFITERADTRSWLTLPGEIQMARVPLAPGIYTVNIELVDKSGHTMQGNPMKNIHISEGKKHYISYHWIPPYATKRH